MKKLFLATSIAFICSTSVFAEESTIPQSTTTVVTTQKPINIYSTSEVNKSKIETEQPVLEDANSNVNTKLDDIYHSGYELGIEAANGTTTSNPKLLPTSKEEQIEWSRGVKDGWKNSNQERLPKMYLSGFNFGKEAKIGNVQSLDESIPNNQDELNAWKRGIHDGWSTTSNEDAPKKASHKYCYNDKKEKFKLGEIFITEKTTLVCARFKSESIWITADRLKSNLPLK